MCLCKFQGYFFQRLGFCNNFDKNVLGYTLGDFFTNSSGHPCRSQLPFIEVCKFNYKQKDWAVHSSLTMDGKNGNGLNREAGWPDWSKCRRLGKRSLWAVFFNFSSGPNFCATFFSRWTLLNLAKNSWATFWAIFSQTHLVTLPRSDKYWRRNVDSNPRFVSKVRHAQSRVAKSKIWSKLRFKWGLN
jgi:hypothetical protein